MKTSPVILTIMVATLIWPACVTLPIENLSAEEAESVLFEAEPVNNTCQVVREGEMFYIEGEACSSIKNITINGTNLGLRNTGLASLGPGDFDGFSQLISLTIELNKKLVKIANGTFQHLKNLTNLTISLSHHAQLSSTNMFQGLENLQHLKLVSSGLQSFTFVSIVARPEMLPSLITLDVSENGFSAITVEDTRFLNCSTIQNLYLTRSSLNWVEPRALDVLTSLQNLRIDDNKLSTSVMIPLIESLTKAVPIFKAINAQSNLFINPYGILSAIASTDIEWVDVSRSSYSVVVTADCINTIPLMPHVKYLDLTGALAVSQNSLFVGTETLPKIESLYIGTNWFFVYPLTISLPTLRVLDLSSNSAPNEHSSLETDEFTLENCTSLEELNLSHNPAFVLRSNFVKGAPNLKILRLSNSSLVEIEPFALSQAEYLQILDLSYNNFRAPESLNRTSFHGLVNLELLNLENCGITCITDVKSFESLQQLKTLNLKQNRMLDLKPHVLDNLVNLEYLDLSFNAFQSWNSRIFEKNLQLKTVQFNDNQITVFYPEMIADLAVPEQATIDSNPFSCVCSDILLLSEFLHSPTRKEMGLVNSLKQPNTYCASPASLRFTSLVSYANNSIHTGECLDDGVTVIIVGTVCALTVLVLVGSTASYFLRWHIKYWIFLLRQFLACHIFPKRKNQYNEGLYKYDAFVSYSNEDRGFVVRLVSMLESHAPYFRLCVFERDFEVGGVITDNVVDSLAKSKRTILILSDAYAKSTWCQWELQLAQHKRLFFKDDRHGPLIIIKIGEIMDKHMTPTLRYLIKTRIYLQWNSDPIKQKVFWEKLRLALSASLDDDEEARPDLQQAVLSTNGNLTSPVAEKVETRDFTNKPGQTTAE